MTTLGVSYIYDGQGNVFFFSSLLIMDDLGSLQGRGRLDIRRARITPVVLWRLRM